MARIPVVYFKISATLLLTGMITVAMEGFFSVPSAFAQAGENMTSPMIESTRYHLKAADGLLMEGNTAAALDQINLAEIQLSLLNMGSQETTMNQTAAMEFIIGGSLSSMKMAANCIIDTQAMVSCMQ
ncbi:MAG: hypothetical protein ACR2IS_19965 [Nitrososphaeraceae archaeon]